MSECVCVCVCTGSESAISVLENCLKQPTLTPPTDSDGHQSSLSDSSPDHTTTSDTAAPSGDRGAGGRGGEGEEGGGWNSELAALLSPVTVSQSTAAKSSLTAKVRTTCTCIANVHMVLCI